MLFREPALLHDFLSPSEAILSSFNWSENRPAGQSYANSDKKTVLVLNTEFPPPILFNAAGHALLGLVSKGVLWDWTLLDYPAPGFETDSKISEYPVVILQAKRSAQLEKLARQLSAAQVIYNVFLDSMIGQSAMHQQQATYHARIGEVRMTCIALFGTEEAIRPLIKSFSVYKVSDAVVASGQGRAEIA